MPVESPRHSSRPPSLPTTFQVSGLTENSQNYLGRHHLNVYIEDVVNKILEDHHLRPLDFLFEYFDSVRKGSHVLLRDFGYVSATPRNRLAFIRRLEEAMSKGYVDPLLDEYYPEDIQQIAELLCADFPIHLVKDAARLVHRMEFGEKSLSDSTLPTSDCSVNFKVVAKDGMEMLYKYFYYFEFFGLLKQSFLENLKFLQHRGIQDMSQSPSMLLHKAHDVMEYLKASMSTLDQPIPKPPMESVERAVISLLNTQQSNYISEDLVLFVLQQPDVRRFIEEDMIYIQKSG